MPGTSQRLHPTIGEHVATLNLFREADGSIWMTVADGRGAVDVAKAESRMPMDVMADWVAEAGQRFVDTWKDTPDA